MNDDSRGDGMEMLTSESTISSPTGGADALAAVVTVRTEAGEDIALAMLVWQILQV